MRYSQPTKISTAGPTPPKIVPPKEIPPSNLIITQQPSTSGMSSVVLSTAGNQATGIAHINQMMAARNPHVGMTITQQQTPSITKRAVPVPPPKKSPEPKKISISQTGGTSHHPVGFTIINNTPTPPTTIFAPTTQIISSPNVQKQQVPQQTYPQQQFSRLSAGSFANYFGMYVLNKQPTKAAEISRILQRTDVHEQRKVEMLSELLGQQSIQQTPQQPVQQIQQPQIQQQQIQQQHIQQQHIQQLVQQSPVQQQQSPSHEKKARKRKAKKKL